MAGSPDCSVCCNAYTGVKRMRVSCAYCQYDACMECYRTYITGNMQDAHCMSCRQTWSRDVLTATFPPSWVNGAYKKHRETILVEREKQLLPESQTLVHNYRMAKQYRTSVDTKQQELRVLKRKIDDVSRQIWNDRHRAERYEYNGFRGVANPNAPTDQKKRAEFLCPCPADTCRGFMGPEMVCGVCNIKACVQCGVVLPVEPDDETGASGSAPHTCNPDVLASFKAIKKQTKPCPKCAVPTFKISGCAQMWCTECQTTWDWNSGDIVKGVIHNPHYFAYMREKSNNGEIPRQPGDGPLNCDRQRFPSAWDVTRACREHLESQYADMDKTSPYYLAANLETGRLSSIQRKLMHIHEVEIPGLRHRYRNTDNADLRLKYLINDITEEDFKIQLQRREKKREKDVACRDIYQMACDTGRDVLWEFVMKERTFKDTLKELDDIRLYANRHLVDVRDKYKNRVDLI